MRLKSTVIKVKQPLIYGLSKVPGDRFGVHITLLSGEKYRFGDYQMPFSIQSNAKVISLTPELHHEGNSIMGMKMLELFTTKTGMSVF